MIREKKTINKKDVFIVGSKGIPAKYGGFETFVENLTKKRISNSLRYHVACLGKNRENFIYNKSYCFNVKVPDIGSAKAILYDILALRECIKYIKNNHIKDPIIYILACRIGPFLNRYKKIVHSLGGSIWVNPDGNEWKRSKWNYFTRKYWKISEKLMVKNSDLLICDSKGIENYIQSEYSEYHPRTIYIAYGANVVNVSLEPSSKKYIDFLEKNDLKSNDYFLIVGRFVPENNYELMIKEFMTSKTDKSLVIITNVKQNKFYYTLKKSTRFEDDKRIKFVGTVYDQELLRQIRVNAYGYLHGHEVGGTNPSLLEALASTKINLLLDVVYNREVGSDGALYFNKKSGELSRLINKADNLEDYKIESLSNNAKNRIKTMYSWNKIVVDYEKLFMSDNL